MRFISEFFGLQIEYTVPNYPDNERRACRYKVRASTMLGPHSKSSFQHLHSLHIFFYSTVFLLFHYPLSNYFRRRDGQHTGVH